VTSLNSKDGGPESVYLTIQDNEGNVIDSTITDENGMFTFDRLMIG